MGAELDLDDVTAGHPVAERELKELRASLKAVLKVLEQEIDTRTCSLKTLRAMNGARSLID
jgi:hypothetical protein